MSKRIRTYNELIKFRTFEERFDYLKLSGVVGESTFGFDRYLNQMLYRSRKWRSIREQVIIRDESCDLGSLDHLIIGQIVIHHMNPITIEDLESQSENVFDIRFLVCTTPGTHNAIHYGDSSLLPTPLIIRKPGDTKLW